jgi:valyl-tRNA synthetase
MHVEELESYDEAPEVETVVTGIDLDYATVGPEFGGAVSDIDAAIEAGDYELADGVLRAAGHELDGEMFAVTEERRYSGDGEMVSAEDADAVVVVRN